MESEKIKRGKKYKYLEYILKKSRRQEAHIKERVRKVVGEMWGIGRKRFGRD